MGCKADGVDEYRSNLMVVRISSRRPTQQTAFYAAFTYSDFNLSTGLAAADFHVWPKIDTAAMRRVRRAATGMTHHGNGMAL